jgi:hypothetical protein
MEQTVLNPVPSADSQTPAAVRVNLPSQRARRNHAHMDEIMASPIDESAVRTRGRRRDAPYVVFPAERCPPIRPG